jgi:MOSC domain-containing protein YiiM
MKASITVCCYLLLACVDIKKSISWDSSQRRCAFHSGTNSWRKNVDVHKHQQASFAATSTVLAAKHESNNIIDALANAIGIKSSKKQPIPRTATKSKSNNSQGHVIRTAARPYQSSGGSLPSSRHYTTRKSSLPMISVSEKGVATDYNHYRTVALKSTQDRAISILTHDVSSYIQTLDGGNFVKADGKGYTDGDLGENVLVKGVDFAFFKVGHRYRFSSQKSSSSNGNNGSSSSSSIIDSADDVVIEITEPMEPCANLCKLPYINDPALPSARDRVAKCQRFIEALGVNDGLRGWYAKVLSGGIIRVDDSVSLVGENV